MIQPRASGGTQSVTVPAGDSIERTSFVTPQTVSGGAGSSVTDLGLAGDVAGNAGTASGFAFQTRTSAPPAGTGNNTITFVT